MISRLLFAAGLTRQRVRAQRRAGNAARDARDWPSAIAGYRAYLIAQPQAWPIWVQLGHAYKEAGELSAAETAYRRAAEDAPHDADAQLQLGRILRMLGRIDEAEAKLAHSAELQPGGDAATELALLRDSPALKAEVTVSPHRDNGDDARDLGQWAVAVGHYSEHLKANPTDAPIWVQLGNMLKETGEYYKAELAYLRAVEIDQTSADSFLQLGRVLKLSGARDAAIRAYQTSEALDSSNGAKAELVAMGVSGAAIASAQVETTLASKDARSTAKMRLWVTLLDAHAARDRRDWAAAAALYRTYLATQQDAGAVWMSLSLILSKAKNYHEALDALDHAARLSPLDAVMAEQRAMLLRHLGRPDEAAYARRALMLRGRREPASDTLTGQNTVSVAKPGEAGTYF